MSTAADVKTKKSKSDPSLSKSQRYEDCLRVVCYVNRYKIQHHEETREIMLPLMIRASSKKIHKMEVKFPKMKKHEVIKKIYKKKHGVEFKDTSLKYAELQSRLDVEVSRTSSRRRVRMEEENAKIKEPEAMSKKQDGVAKKSEKVGTN